jgi:hypothetical protein
MQGLECLWPKDRGDPLSETDRFQLYRRHHQSWRALLHYKQGKNELHQPQLVFKKACGVIGCSKPSMERDLHFDARQRDLSSKWIYERIYLKISDSSDVPRPILVRDGAGREVLRIH